MTTDTREALRGRLKDVGYHTRHLRLSAATKIDEDFALRAILELQEHIEAREAENTRALGSAATQVARLLDDLVRGMRTGSFNSRGDAGQEGSLVVAHCRHACARAARELETAAVPSAEILVEALGACVEELFAREERERDSLRAARNAALNWRDQVTDFEFKMGVLGRYASCDAFTDEGWRHLLDRVHIPRACAVPGCREPALRGPLPEAAQAGVSPLCRSHKARSDEIYRARASAAGIDIAPTEHDEDDIVQRVDLLPSPEELGDDAMSSRFERI